MKMSRPDENKNEHPVVHPIPPVYRADSRILILGSFPSVKSRETGFFYGHPQNRFWKVTAAVCGEEVPQTVEEKKAFLLRNHIAVWDVIASCVITGSSDASIRDVVPNPLQDILECADIRQIYCNGQKIRPWGILSHFSEKEQGFSTEKGRYRPLPAYFLFFRKCYSLFDEKYAADGI